MGILRTMKRTATADRSRLVGASDAPVIMGLSPWMTAFALWAQRNQGEAQVDINVTKRGRHLEHGLLRWLAEEVGASSIEDGIPLSEPGLAGPEPFMSSRPDGALLIDGVWEGAEIKTSRLVAEWGDEDGTDQIPLHYLAQVQWQMACMPGIGAVRVGAYLPVQDRLRVFRVLRDDELIKAMIGIVGEWFHRHIERGEAPDIDASPACTDYLRKRFPRQTEPMREATDTETKLVLDLAAAKAATKAAKASEDLLANQLRAAIADSEGLAFDGGKASYKWQAGAKRLDTERLRAEYPEAAAACTVQGDDMRVLRLSGKALKGDE